MKKEERIVEILNEVDEKYIEEAAPAPEKKIHYGWKTWAGMAAAAICVAGISWYGFGHFGNRNMMTPGTETVQETAIAAAESTETEILKDDIVGQKESSDCTVEVETPQYHEDGRLMLTAELNVDGMGFEGLMFYDISESGSANPWTRDAEMETLPVYRNLSYVDGPGYAVWFDDETLLHKAEAVAESLGTEIISTDYDRVREIYGKVPEEIAEIQNKTCRLTAKTESGRIEVDGDGDISIYFDEAIELPAEYSFTDEDTSDAQAEETIQYLVKQYAGLKSLENPIADSWGDYSFSGSKHRSYSAFDGSGTLAEQILNYNFDDIQFYTNSEGKLWIIRYGNVLESAEKIDDYPIISWETAQEMLVGGEYITTVPENYLEDGEIKEEYIAKVELVYRSGSLEEMYMPYYRFYVELTQIGDTKMAEGLKNYGAFYVPAVSGEYLTNFTVWDGRFN